jgi:copper(I)-binding protein
LFPACCLNRGRPFHIKDQTMLNRLILCATLVFSTPSLAHDYTVGALTLDHPYIPAAIGNAPAAGGFLTITNSGTEPDALIGVEAPFAGMAMLHETVVDGDGVARMSHIERLDIPAGGTVALERGGLHIMFMDLAEPPVEGMMLPATLIFEKAGPVTVEFKVEPRSGGGDHSSHTGHAAPSN